MVPACRPIGCSSSSARWSSSNPSVARGSVSISFAGWPKRTVDEPGRTALRAKAQPSIWSCRAHRRTAMSKRSRWPTRRARRDARPSGANPVSVHPKKSAPRRTARCDDPPSEALLHGIDEFNRQEFFEQHETLEAIWIHEPDAVRYLYQGILQVGVGFYHWRRGNWRGAVAKRGHGLAK